MALPAALLIAYVLVGLAYWLSTAYGLVRLARGVPRLEDARPPDRDRWPRLSVIVPACNEADKIEPALRSLLAEDYPNLELVLVDDRSTDATGEIIDRLAAGDDRAKVLHLRELPDGWLGKVHALQRGLEAATGEWALFTDADVHFRPGLLRRAVDHAEAGRLDHLVVIPNLWPTNLLLDAMIALFIRHFLLATRPWALGDPASRACLGVGAFNLVRRAAFEATPGFEWLRLEPADDMGVGLLMKEAGARRGAASAFTLLGLHWYRTLGEAMRGAERGWATVSRFSVARTVAAAVAMTGLELAPFLTLAPLACGTLRPIGCAGLAVFLAYVLCAVVVSRWAGARKLLPSLVAPLLAPLSAAIFVRNALVGRRRGGIEWRGTLYTTDALRAGSRLRFP